MAFEKGKAKTGGRKKGEPNKSTENAKAAIAAFVDGNAGRLNTLLDKIERDNGAKAAFDSITSLLEYHMPKLSRSDGTLSNPDGTNLLPDALAVTLVRPSGDTKPTDT